MRDVAGSHQRAVNAAQVNGQHVVDEHLHRRSATSDHGQAQPKPVAGQLDVLIAAVILPIVLLQHPPTIPQRSVLLGEPVHDHAPCKRSNIRWRILTASTHDLASNCMTHKWKSHPDIVVAVEVEAFRVCSEPASGKTVNNLLQPTLLKL